MVGAKLKSLFEEQAKQRQQAAGGDKKSYEASVTQEVKSVPVNLPPSIKNGDSRDKAASVVNVSPRSVQEATKVIERGATLADALIAEQRESKAALTLLNSPSL